MTPTIITSNNILIDDYKKSLNDDPVGLDWSQIFKEWYTFSFWMAQVAPRQLELLRQRHSLDLSVIFEIRNVN
jgi:hypothetical protein